MGLFDNFKKKNKTSQQAKSQSILEEQNISMVIVKDVDKVNAILNDEIEEFFPETGNWWSSCFSKPNDVNYSNLPCHLRDNRWMSKLLRIKLADKGISINTDEIEKFMNESEEFNRKRHSYELKIVVWQIKWMRNGGEGWLMPKGHDEFSLLFGPDVDKIFRDGVVKTLLAIGMEKEIIEEGIEKNASIWRGSCMSQSFDHMYRPVVYLKGSPNPPEPTHKQNWMKMRLYEYYAEHKESVDKFSYPTPEMLMSEEEVKVLRKELNRQNSERQAYIDEWHKSTKPKCYNQDRDSSYSR